MTQDSIRELEEWKRLHRDHLVQFRGLGKKYLTWGTIPDGTIVEYPSVYLDQAKIWCRKCKRKLSGGVTRKFSSYRDPDSVRDILFMEDGYYCGRCLGE